MVTKMPIFAIIISIAIIIFSSLYFYYFKPSPTNLPPGPRPLPIIGNFHLLGHLPHRALAKLAQQYGPIMFIRLGQVPAIVVSSPQAAELVLKQNDAVCSGRPKIQAWLYGSKAMAFTPYGYYWRRVRTMCAVHLLSAAKIAEFEGLRMREIEGVVVGKLAAAAAAREVVDVDKVVGELIEDLVLSMVVGKGNEGKGTRRFDLKGVVAESLRLAGEFNLADLVPFLRPLDLQGIGRKVKVLRKQADEIFDNIIEDHLKVKESVEHKDILATMLDLTINENKLSSSFDLNNVKAIMYELFAGGIDTTLATIGWTLSSLLKNPCTMKTLQEELDLIVGRERMVKESDLSKLSYLDMVVKEATRLYPIAPMLIPHESMEDVVINGYEIPKHSRIIVNVWAIGRDPKVWSENAEEFYPERFMGNDIDVYGHHFELLPFGAGRRKCPGLQLGLINVKLILAQLVHCFDWELPNSMKLTELDMTEKFGLSMPKANHLLAIPSSRLHFLHE